MFIAKVTGSVIATQKVESMVGNKLLVVEPYRLEPQDRSSLVTTGRTFIAVDMLGAGVGDYVLITQGSSARLTPETKHLPIDCVVVGIVDQAHIDHACVYSREETPAPEAKPEPAAKKSKPKAAPAPKPTPLPEPEPTTEPEADSDE
ncbi:ethanolamine utilization protein EutN [Blastopirellula marina]|uniref:Probable ethanolamine utilization protein EutN n=1 Tax=Blastopirellula marina DSM 3645 TaxID=314230 RepID=A4A2M2_9BACT|nr:ethanolamine utilization protein EutN [Blastopirellula marina]EAQ76993.1 probable ethanolamine utilization protein EutN [Blastopirellula marina DSM 3645]